jgi:hypothetical protein
LPELGIGSALADLGGLARSSSRETERALARIGRSETGERRRAEKVPVQQDGTRQNDGRFEAQVTLMRDFKEFALSAALATILLVLSMGIMGLVGAASPDIVPGLAPVLIVVLAVVAVYRAAKSSSVLPVAAGVTVPAVVLSALATVSLLRNVPGVGSHPGIVKGIVATAISSFLIGVVSAYVGRALFRKFYSGERVPEEPGK